MAKFRSRTKICERTVVTRIKSSRTFVNINTGAIGLIELVANLTVAGIASLEVSADANLSTRVHYSRTFVNIYASVVLSVLVSMHESCWARVGYA